MEKQQSVKLHKLSKNTTYESFDNLICSFDQWINIQIARNT